MAEDRKQPTPEEPWLAKYKVDDQEEYEPAFDRLGTERRVLGHISDEDHVGRGARNTAERLAQELAEDPYTAIESDDEDAEEERPPAIDVVQGHLDALEQAGLVEQDDGVYRLTDGGFTELAN